ncbi:phosphatase 2C-like domain-containing protein [Mucor mucedo]|uniref:phosphatase 2C-like domain-containing protein n=1 Tax=Mucor mucedo TaxID=29922 RepID=UPI00221F00A3|nr:phosphatase 2C-like domain-containing protein [Mucor mucedo]KAI7889899.1 phosphatase 2C-like domain-containing protein [Mucor mucedo]
MGQTLSEPIVEKTTHEGKNSNLMYALSCMQGWRLTMEDAHCAELDLDGTKASFFGVYDGHGGSTVAQYTGQTLHHRVLESPLFGKKYYTTALVESFMQLDRELIEDQNFSYDPSGCTAVTVLVTPDQKEIYCANAGDSRSVISTAGKSKPLSYDHKPTDPKENQRIVNAGGFVEFGRVNGNLALSRAIGDFEFKQNNTLPAEQQAVTCDPDVIKHTIESEDEFIVLACDGIWDCMTNQQVVSYIRQALSQKTKLGEICEQIMDDCLAVESDGGGFGCDNMSVIIVAILNGKSEEEWYDWMAARTAPPKKDGLGNDIVMTQP